MDDKQIYYLCERIRVFCKMDAAIYLLRRHESKIASDVVAKTDHYTSDVSGLINSYKWDELFKNEDWLSRLEDAQSLNCLKNNKEINEALLSISQLFPEETEGRIIPEMLNV